jgi:hypothetical protein
MESTFRFLKHELNLEQGTASFFYQLQTPDKTYDFTETLQFPKIKLNTRYQILSTILDNLLLLLGISYWKTTCGKIELPENVHMNKNQTEFWNTIYTKGLGEFYYKNKIDFRGLVNFPYNEKNSKKDVISSIERDPVQISPLQQVEGRNGNSRSLLFFGGGKDSIVSAELLKKANKPFTLFMVNSSDIQKQTAQVVGAEQLVVKRILDPKLLELNKQPGIHNGHIPVSAVWAYIGLFAAELYGYKYLITSNEQSANYGNVEYLGTEVNHQWSKSEEFEKMFMKYLNNNITQNITYFSLLRPIHEIKIAELFSKYEQYFPYFSSCNRNFVIHESRFMNHDSRWCGECPKCLFVFIILSAFLPKEKLRNIFGKNLYQDENLLPLLRELTGVENFKPFECVGTPEETLLALFLAHQSGEYETDFLMKCAKNDILPIIQNPDILKQTLFAVTRLDSLPSYFQNIR